MSENTSHNYLFSIEDLEGTYAEFEPLYRQHYGEMQKRLMGQGIAIPPYNPNLAYYFDFARGGGLIHYSARLDGKAVGYGNCYVFHDMHNQVLSAQEDTIYMLPEHRNGVGRRLLKFVLSDLQQRGVKSLTVTAMTDLRVAKLWQRMGFKPVATTMRYEF